MPAADAPDLARIHARVLNRDEAAMRELVREHGAALSRLAEAAGGRRRGRPLAGVPVVEAAMLQFWTDADDWRPAQALDLLLYECVRDTALAVRRRSLSPRRAAANWRPRRISGSLPATGLLAAILPDEFRAALQGLQPDAREAIDRAWLAREESGDANEALDQLCRAAGISAGPSSGGRAAARLAACTAISREEALRAEAVPPAGLEQALISRIRSTEGLKSVPAPLERPRRPWRQRALLAAASLAAACAIAATTAGITYLATDGPIDGRAIALTSDGATGVILPRWDERPAALIFWGLAAPAENERWQLWSVRASGALLAGPFLSPNADGRAAIPLDPDPQAEADPIAGYALTLDDPSARINDTPSRDSVRYQFVLD